MFLMSEVPLCASVDFGAEKGRRLTKLASANRLRQIFHRPSQPAQIDLCSR